MLINLLQGNIFLFHIVLEAKKINLSNKTQRNIDINHPLVNHQVFIISVDATFQFSIHFFTLN